jgi:sodium-dependent phosphate cotransporter
MLAALSVDSSELRSSLQIALCHLFFNISGIVLFYPIPFMRWPIPLAKIMGRTVAKYRWFAILYLIFMFFLLPLYAFALSLLSPIVLYIGIIPFVLLLLVVVLINVTQHHRPHWLPKKLQSWAFLPEPLRSLDPYDR